MSFQEADNLFKEIRDFLEVCGGIYSKVLPYDEEKILVCLAQGTFLFTRDVEGKINHFLCWSFFDEDQLEYLLEDTEPYCTAKGKYGLIWVHGHTEAVSLVWLIKFFKERHPWATHVIWSHKGEGKKIFELRR